MEPSNGRSSMFVLGVLLALGTLAVAVVIIARPEMAFWVGLFWLAVVVWSALMVRNEVD